MSGRGGVGAAARRLAQRDGHRVMRPIAGSSAMFPLTYVRTGPREQQGRRPDKSVPVLVIPGGPGLASVVPYASFRSMAARRALDVVMVEHRGIGLSRRDTGGEELPVSAVTVEHVIEDLEAVLDHAGIDQVVVYGCSYGTYLAQAFAARYPDRVSAMVLDSTMLSVEDDLAAVRAHRRRLFWDGVDPALAPVAAAVRQLAADGVPMIELDRVVQLVYEFAGPQALHRLLLARQKGRLQRTWDYVSRLGAEELDGAGRPYLIEPELVAGIMYEELGYALPRDGHPLDPQLALTTTPRPAYRGEPFSLPAELPQFTWPTVVISGERDLRTPPPIAHRVANLIPGAQVLPLAGTGHSALDTHPLAALHAIRAAVEGTLANIPHDARAIAALPRRGTSRLVGSALNVVVTATTRRP
ncbi:alpha/beta hydrolase [Dietzia sp. B19]|uniref:alpha/beta fold hydrolase n=1 Tax=Dietzia sp. B19 TaxID=1630632 RepID=UPI0015F81F12|nr:alpha/beta fold hydrolase [Dietzia sp. B19]MBB1058608.1 alpha/beta hydrolase [Dietzia sp. B19]